MQIASSKAQAPKPSYKPHSAATKPSEQTEQPQDAVSLSLGHRMGGAAVGAGYAFIVSALPVAAASIGLESAEVLKYGLLGTGLIGAGLGATFAEQLLSAPPLD